jgi:ribosomal-protein-alanine N-acetyltransferase
MRKFRSPASYNQRVPAHIRDALRQDFDGLWRLDQACFLPGISYSRLELAVYMRKPGAFTLIAERPATPKTRSFGGGPTELLGFLVAHALADQTGHIITLDVAAAARRTGVGSQLMTAAEERLRAAACQSVHLEAAVDNLAAIAFYQRHGYSILHTVPHYYSNGVDALVLTKELLSSGPDI